MHGSIATAWRPFSPSHAPMICPPPNLAFISSLDCRSGLRASVASGAPQSQSQYLFAVRLAAACKPSFSASISPPTSTPRSLARDCHKHPGAHGRRRPSQDICRGVPAKVAVAWTMTSGLQTVTSRDLAASHARFPLFKYSTTLWN
jgi:hypothetical protein